MAYAYEPTDFVMSMRGKFHRPKTQQPHCELRKVLDKRPISVAVVYDAIDKKWGRFVVCAWCIGPAQDREEALDLLGEIRDGII